uniref:Uncharacterized protein n=1 Tax=Leersia perrieri TaxID=77586 RepID=A0A0D9WPG5_9ORYZ
MGGSGFSGVELVAVNEPADCPKNIRYRGYWLSRMIESPARCPASVSCQTPPGGLNPAVYVTVATRVANNRRYFLKSYSNVRLKLGMVQFKMAIR